MYFLRKYADINVRMFSSICQHLYKDTVAYILQNGVRIDLFTRHKDIFTVIVIGSGSKSESLMARELTGSYPRLYDARENGRFICNSNCDLATARRLSSPSLTVGEMLLIPHQLLSYI